MEQKKIYEIYAGINGAGKSTLYCLRGDESKLLNRVNSDEILKENGGDWRSVSDQSRAMSEAVLRIKEYFREGVSFNQESTLTGKSIISNIRKAKELGYSVQMYYVGLDSADLAIQRVKNRVSEGGHGIDEPTIRSRYNTSLENLIEAVKLCDSVAVYDNSGMFKDVGRTENGVWVEFDKQCEWLNRTFPNVDLEKSGAREADPGNAKESSPLMSMNSYKARISEMKNAGNGKKPVAPEKIKGHRDKGGR